MKRCHATSSLSYHIYNGGSHWHTSSPLENMAEIPVMKMFTFITAIFAVMSIVSAENIRGVVQLNMGTFDKVNKELSLCSFNKMYIFMSGRCH